ncbi:MAG: hypothetical protein JWO05_3214 [Gemmatimonadetes bacterium]|nr:hypothetical protein [Gemmatimonadota bacterium]
MNDCPNGEIRDLLPDHLHARLDAASRAEVDAHLSGCVDCREELDLLRGLRGSFATPRVDVARIVAAIPRAAVVKRPLVRRWQLAAAAAILVVGGASLLSLPQRDQLISPPETTRVADMSPVARVADSAPVASESSIVTATGRATPVTELAMSDDMSDLSAAEMKSLLADISKLDATPLSEPGVVVPAPIGQGGANE